MLASADSVAEIQDAVRDATRVLPVSGGTKPALCGSADDTLLTLDVSGLSGLVEYDPAELTFTAHAATPVREVEATWASTLRAQWLQRQQKVDGREWSWLGRR